MAEGPRRRKIRPNGHVLSLREFVAPRSFDAGTGGAIVDFYVMAEAISAEGFETGLHRLWRRIDTGRPTAAVIARIAEHLSRKISGLKADILRKAIQETLFHAAGIGYGPQPLNVKVGLEKFLRKRGSKKLLELFLSSYVFNTVWIRMQDAVRMKLGSRFLTNSIIAIERFCVSVVKSVLSEWDAAGKLDELPTKRRLGSTLIKTIQARLVENPIHL